MKKINMKNNLKQFRKDSKLSLSAISDMCNVSKSHFHSLEKETGSSPTLFTAYSIAKVLNKSVYDIWPDTISIVEETITIRRIKIDP